VSLAQAGTQLLLAVNATHQATSLNLIINVLHAHLLMEQQLIQQTRHPVIVILDLCGTSNGDNVFARLIINIITMPLKNVQLAVQERIFFLTINAVAVQTKPGILIHKHVSASLTQW
jgi:hypothetical protein